MTKTFKVTQRAAEDLGMRGGSGLMDLRLKTLIEDRCEYARSVDDVLPPFATQEGDSIAFFVCMEPTKENDLKESMYLLVTEDKFDDTVYAVVAAWTEPFYHRQRTSTGLNGGMVIPTLDRKKTEGFTMPRRRHDTPVPPASITVDRRPTQDEVFAKVNESRLAELRNLFNQVSTSLDADYIIFVIDADGLIQKATPIHQADDADGKRKIELTIEDLMRQGHSKEKLRICKTLTPKITVHVEF